MTNKPHKHADLIKAWADGAEIELMRTDGSWMSAGVPTWSESCSYRIKPEPPKYPQTNLSRDELHQIFSGASRPMSTCGHRALANAAIARAIEDGQVIPLDEHVKEMGDAYLQGNDAGRKDMVPATMLEKVARAVADNVQHTIYVSSRNGKAPDEELRRIIASVREGK